MLQQLGLSPQSNEANRKHPRFRFNPQEKTLLVQIGTMSAVLIDISVGGASLHLKTPLSVNRDIQLVFDQKFRGRARVVNTFLDESDDPDTMGIYRTGTRFIDDSEGYRCTVQVLRFISRIPPDLKNGSSFDPEAAKGLP